MSHVRDRRRLRGFVVAFACAAAAFTVLLAASGAAGGVTRSATVSPIDLTNELAPSLEVDAKIPNSQSAAHVPAAHVPRPVSKQIVASNPGFGGFAALTHRDQRTADGGNQLNLEPPDQGLCVGAGRVIEPINDVFAVFDTSGAKLSPATGGTSLTVFFTGQHQIDRTPPVRFGPFLSDPKCYFDPALNRFFMTVLEVDRDPVTGALGPRAHTLFAVSKTAAPTTSSSDWFIYSIDATDDGNNGTPSHPGCPCFGDQPLIGADANAFVITTNEFNTSFFAGAPIIFNGAQIYVIDKAAAAAGTLSFQFIGGSPIPLEEGPAFSLQPATSPTAAEWSSANGGTEFLLSDLDFDATLDNRIAVWALTHTNAIATHGVQLSHVVIKSQVYGQPPDAQQQDGPTPLADVTPNAFTGKPGSGPTEHLELIAGNDDRMNQAVFAAGKLWGGVNTVVKTENGITHVGIAYFIVSPSFPNAGTLSATIANQGYISVNGENVLYPSIGVNSSGKGVVGFSLVGPDFFPSAAYAPIDAANGAGDVHIAAAGAGPDDGFSGYNFFSGGNTGRWGDYSAAVADSSGTIWIGHEFIPNAPRTLLANWGTFVSHVTP